MENQIFYWQKNSRLFLLLLVFLFFGCKKKDTSKLPSTNIHVDKKEKTVVDFLSALSGKTVEDRIKNLMLVFMDGDYLTQNSLFYLAGINPVPEENERSDVATQRAILKKIERIEKEGDHFNIVLTESTNIEETLPIFERKNGELEKKMDLDIVVAEDARLYISPVKNGVKVDLDKVKVGKGFFMFSFPTLIIKDDDGYMLGLKFFVAR
ncbi:hypothetical protein [Flexithrix dorotheae]|uniref:hypothetical protein n=1 Tax=Flexithrix dorotheae TaxID=70993 RepID=UPI00036C1F07|nr:hypothetical protein [Flexithrix dorotheae]